MISNSLYDKGLLEIGCCTQGLILWTWLFQLLFAKRLYNKDAGEQTCRYTSQCLAFMDQEICKACRCCFSEANIVANLYPPRNITEPDIYLERISLQFVGVEIGCHIF